MKVTNQFFFFLVLFHHRTTILWSQFRSSETFSDVCTKIPYNLVPNEAYTNEAVRACVLVCFFKDYLFCVP